MSSADTSKNSSVQFLQKVTDSIFLNTFWNCKMMFCYLSGSMIFHYYPATMESALICPIWYRSNYTPSQFCLEGIKAITLTWNDFLWLSKALRQFTPISSLTSKFLSIFISGIILCKYFHCWMFSGERISSDVT